MLHSLILPREVSYLHYVGGVGAKGVKLTMGGGRIHTASSLLFLSSLPTAIFNLN